MSKILDSNDFGLKIYNRFPLKYREDDIDNKFALKRYLEALSEGGYKLAIDEITGLTYLIDPDKAPTKVLPTLFKQYGLDVFNGVPESYLRYLLPRLGEAWSKKGSLSAVEFISSSLSGTKTTSSTHYDEQGNPIIDVRLEMDYNLGDYFPDMEQFKRLLVNFVPFYTDIAIVYVYMFFENQVLKGREDDILNIKDIKEESGLIKLKKRSKEEIQKLGEIVLGESTLGSEEYADEFKDNIKMGSVIDLATFANSDRNSLTNDNYSVLNSSFYTNGLTTYDIITYSDGRVEVAI